MSFYILNENMKRNQMKRKQKQTKLTEILNKKKSNYVFYVFFFNYK